MSLNEFREIIYKVDSLAEVTEHQKILGCVRVRPSHPRYLEALVKTVELYRPMGVCIAMVEEIEVLIPAAPKFTSFGSFIRYVWDQYKEYYKFWRSR